MRVEVCHSPVQPQISGGQGSVMLTNWANRWVGEVSFARGVACDDLQINLPDLPDFFTMIETTGADETFFCVSKLLPPHSRPERWQAKRLAIAWDASGSRTSIDRDLNFLKALFATWEEMTVDLVVFAEATSENRTFFVNANNGETFFNYLRQLPYDGATDLGAVNFAAPPHIEDEAWLLFSDGLTTLNQDLPQIGRTIIHAVTSQATSDTGVLRYLCEQTGGQFINLMSVSPEGAAGRLLAGCEPLPNVESHGCADILKQSTGGRLLLYGRMLDESGSLRENTIRLEVSLERSQAVTGDMVARQWAGAQIHKLSLTCGNASGEILALARKYGVASPQTSLLVLETVDQYLEYTIEPPISQPAMLAEYRKRLSEMATAVSEVHVDHLQEVIRLWNLRVGWWQTEFTWVPKKRSVQTETNSNRRSSFSEEVEMFSGEVDMADTIDMAPPTSHADAMCCCDEGEDDLAFGNNFRESRTDENEPTERKLPVHKNASATRLKPWSSDTPYLEALKKCTKKEEAYSVYIDLRKEYALSPAFFFDCGDYFLENLDRENGLKILSNLLEMNLEDVGLMRMYAWRLQQAGELDRVIAIFRRVLSLREDEPQSYRDLALALADRWEQKGAEKDITESMNLLYQVVLREWDNFPEIELIALMELNRLIYASGKAGFDTPEYVDQRLIKKLDLDLRVSMSWDADLTDIDLHVHEPTGDHAYYANHLTGIGGLVSKDFRNGYGPEEYVLRKAFPGTYEIKAHYFGSQQQTLFGPCTVIVTVFTDYCREGEKKETLCLRLDQAGSDFLVGEVVFSKD
jgi:Ca-activated chloride channel homolog